jgi:hypothetical protein
MSVSAFEVFPDATPDTKVIAPEKVVFRRQLLAGVLRCDGNGDGFFVDVQADVMHDFVHGCLVSCYFQCFENDDTVAPPETNTLDEVCSGPGIFRLPLPAGSPLHDFRAHGHKSGFVLQ